MTYKYLNIDWDKFDKESNNNISIKKNPIITSTIVTPVTITTAIIKPVTTTIPIIKTNTILYPYISNSAYYYNTPLFVESNLVYPNINKDQNLRRLMTYFYLKKCIKWISKYNEFTNLEKLLPELKTRSGYKLIYKLLHQFVKKYNINWYDLKKHYQKIKDYLAYKLKKVIDLSSS